LAIFPFQFPQYLFFPEVRTNVESEYIFIFSDLFVERIVNSFIGFLQPRINKNKNNVLNLDFIFKMFTNVLQLKEVATSQNQAKTNITQTFEFSEKIRKYAIV
jgi:hypothetical protein